jgi:ubiquinone/menaquinone biosynthesis C-methylase UbiE
LELHAEVSSGHEVLAGSLQSRLGRRYAVVEGVAVLIDRALEPLGHEEKRENGYYQAVSQSYDEGMNWLFRSFFADEDAVRRGMVDLLGLQPQHRVLEIGCGTCRDSTHIASLLGPGGALYLQDLSASMLAVGQRRMTARLTGAAACTVDFFVGNVAHLPFADGFFDAAFHFGGLNLFTDKKQALAEMTRVVRVGGKVVVGDEGLAPWHRGSLYGNILANSNKLYLHQCPLECLPECARDVAVRWVLGNAFYLIDYRVGAGHPEIDLDLPIPGRRGGTHRTRYFGTLEGVEVATKDLVLKAAARSGLSVHEWLTRAARSAAERDGVASESGAAA